MQPETPTKILNHTGLIYLISKYKKTRLAEIGAKPKTKNNYGVFFNNLMGFISTRPEIGMDEVDIDFGLEYKDYLASYIQSITHVSRNIEFLRNALEYAVDEGMLIRNPLRKFKAKRDQVPEIFFLSKPEVLKFSLYKGEFQQPKDMFVLQCLTGMSYGDLWSYDIVTDDLGDWIYNKRNKNNKKYWVPLNQVAKEICLKYSHRFKVIDNHEYNIIIRDVAKSVGIDKYIKSHAGRKTFATTMYQDGWSVEAISDMMGIHVITLTKHYINHNRLRIEAEVKQRMEVKASGTGV